VAIRPVDLQGAIFQATQNAGVQKTAEDAPRAAQIAAQAQFVEQLEHRQESVAETGGLEGNKVNAETEREGSGTGYRPRRHHKPGEPLQEDAVELAQFGDGEHTIDFTA
jgi:hypothetical protein